MPVRRLTRPPIVVASSFHNKPSRRTSPQDRLLYLTQRDPATSEGPLDPSQSQSPSQLIPAHNRHLPFHPLLTYVTTALEMAVIKTRLFRWKYFITKSSHCG